MRLLRTRCVALVLTALFGWTVPTSGQSTIPIDVRLSVPLVPVPASDGVHLLYEIHVVNFRGVAVELVALEIIGDNGRSLQRLEAEALSADIARPGASGEERPAIIGGGSFAVVMVELVVDAGEVPASLSHRFEVVLGDRTEATSFTTSPVRVQPADTVPVLSRPLVGDGWIAVNGLSNDSDHRRAIIPLDGSAAIAQRYAIDWVRFGTDGLLTSGDPTRNENWVGYGAEVLAVGSGVVVSTKDGIPQNTPLTGDMAVPITLETIGGNSVTIELDTGEFAFYGHLVPGSLRVEPGQRVSPGQVLGQVGNSGNSDGPHLHFHVTDGPSPLAAEGIPFVFDQFELLSVEEDIEQFLEGQPWTAPADRSATQRRREMPLAGAVVSFGSS